MIRGSKFFIFCFLILLILVGPISFAQELQDENLSGVDSLKPTYSNEKVVLKESWLKEEGYWYYYISGQTQKGWQAISGSVYYFDSSGIMQTGWLNDGGNWYYLSNNGAMQTGWVKLK